MKAVISDFDGIIVETEPAKAVGWYAAVKQLKGELSEDNVADIIAQNDDGRVLAQQINQELRGSGNSHLPKNEGDRARLVGKYLQDTDMNSLAGKTDFELAVACAGGTTADFRNNIWDVFCANDPKFKGITPDDRTKQLEQLEKNRTGLKPPFMVLGAQPLPENQGFFKELIINLGEGKIALVNQSKSKDMNDLFQNNSLWNGEPRLATYFGEYNEGNGIPRAVCVGDKQQGVGDKADAYKKACEIMGVKPSETMTFEDTQSGLDAAKQAGIGIIIGFKSAESLQELKGAHYIVEGNLQKINTIAQNLGEKTVNDVRVELNQLAQKNQIRQQITPIEELEPPQNTTNTRRLKQ
jgi:beta-phosphoglucomutase-like phosphatase (HAD superfamily)